VNVSRQLLICYVNVNHATFALFEAGRLRAGYGSGVPGVVLLGVLGLGVVLGDAELAGTEPRTGAPLGSPGMP